MTQGSRRRRRAPECPAPAARAMPSPCRVLLRAGAARRFATPEERLRFSTKQRWRRPLKFNGRGRYGADLAEELSAGRAGRD